VAVPRARQQDLWRPCAQRENRRSSNRAAALLRIAAVNVGRTQTAWRLRLPFGRSRRQSQGRDGDGSQARGTLLLCAAIWSRLTPIPASPTTTRNATASECCTICRAKSLGLAAVPQSETLAHVRKRFRRTTMNDKDQPLAATVVDRQLRQPAPNRRCHGVRPRSERQALFRRHPQPPSPFVVGWMSARLTTAISPSRPSRWPSSAAALTPPAAALEPGAHSGQDER